jgi:hypothetical protein
MIFLLCARWLVAVGSRIVVVRSLGASAAPERRINTPPRASRQGTYSLVRSFVRSFVGSLGSLDSGDSDLLCMYLAPPALTQPASPLACLHTRPSSIQPPANATHRAQFWSITLTGF